MFDQSPGIFYGFFDYTKNILKDDWTNDAYKESLKSWKGKWYHPI